MRYYVIVREEKRDAKTGKAPVALLFKEGSRRFTLNTGLYATEKMDGMSFGPKEKNGRTKTLRLVRIIESVDRYLIQADTSDWERTRNEVCALVAGKSTGPKPLHAYISEFAATKKQGRTRELYELTAKKVVAYDGRATFDTVSVSWLDGFVRHMDGASVNNVSIQLRNIRAVFNWAITNGWTEKYPFRRYKIKTERTEIRNISVEELRAIRDCAVPGWMEVYRDLFMLSFYLCGMNPIDMLHLRHGDVRGGRVRYRRAKTGHVFDLPVPEEAAAIIERYRGRDWLLCPMDTLTDYRHFAMRWNSALKKLGPVTAKANAAGQMYCKEYHPICLGLTVYAARYTFASIGAQLDIPRETIALCLGHEWADVTSHYISYDTRKIDAAVAKIVDFVGQKY